MLAVLKEESNLLDSALVLQRVILYLASALGLQLHSVANSPFRKAVNSCNLFCRSYTFNQLELLTNIPPAKSHLEFFAFIYHLEII